MGRPGMYIRGVKPPRKYSFTPFKLACAQQTKTMLIMSGNSSCTAENSCWHIPSCGVLRAFRSFFFLHPNLHPLLIRIFITSPIDDMMIFYLNLSAIIIVISMIDSEKSPYQMYLRYMNVSSSSKFYSGRAASYSMFVVTVVLSHFLEKPRISSN